MGPNRRAGVLTILLLAQFAYADNTSPIHPGVFLARHRRPHTRPPPNAIQFKDSEFKRTKPCAKRSPTSPRRPTASCHSVINPLGFALENFDAIGRWRTKEKGRPINSSSEYITATNTPLSSLVHERLLITRRTVRTGSGILWNGTDTSPSRPQALLGVKPWMVWQIL